MKAQVCMILVYIWKKLNNYIFNFIILVLYLNEMLILTKNQYDVDRCKNQLKSISKMEDLYKYQSILEIKIHTNMIKKSL